MVVGVTSSGPGGQVPRNYWSLSKVRGLAQVLQTMSPLDYTQTATQRELLPGSGPDLHIVLFWRMRDLGLKSFMAAFRGARWPKHASVGVLEIDSAENVRDWFGISQTPAVVAIADGSILGIEFDCSSEACERLLACAQRQLRLLDGSVV